MKNTSNLFILIIFLLSQNISVSASDLYMGYMGKRLALNVDFGYAPNFLGTLNKNREQSIFKSTIKKEIGITYLSNKKTAWIYTHANQNFAFDSDFSFSSVWGQSSSTFHIQNPVMQAITHQIAYRYYKHNCAPIGPYISFSLSSHRVKSANKEGFAVVSNDQDAPKNLHLNTTPIQMYGVGIQSGQSMHLVDKLFLNFSIEGKFVFGLNGVNESKLNNDMALDFSIRNIFNIKLGLNYFL